MCVWHVVFGSACSWQVTGGSGDTSHIIGRSDITNTVNKASFDWSLDKHARACHHTHTHTHAVEGKVYNQQKPRGGHKYVFALSSFLLFHTTEKPDLNICTEECLNYTFASIKAVQ